MAMPAVTGMPCMMKLIGRAWFRVLGSEFQIKCPASLAQFETRNSKPALLAFFEIIGDKPGERQHGFLLIGTVGLDTDGRAFCRGQHHYAHDTFGVNALA